MRGHHYLKLITTSVLGLFLISSLSVNASSKHSHNHHQTNSREITDSTSREIKRLRQHFVVPHLTHYRYEAIRKYVIHRNHKHTKKGYIKLLHIVHARHNKKTRKYKKHRKYNVKFAYHHELSDLRDRGVLRNPSSYQKKLVYDYEAGKRNSHDHHHERYFNMIGAVIRLNHHQDNYYPKSKSSHKYKKNSKDYVNDNSTFKKQVIKRTFHDINSDRAKYGLMPYKYSPTLTKLAQQRTKTSLYYLNDNNFDGDIHNDPKTGKPFRSELITKEHITPAELDGLDIPGENVTPIYFSHDFKWGADSFANEPAEDTTTPNGVADDEENAMIHYDYGSEQNGHRVNILDKDAKYVGLAVYFNKDNKIYNKNPDEQETEGVLVEEFA